MNLEILSYISNIVLVVVNVVLIHIAYKTLSLSKSFNDKQLKISSHPYLHLSLFKQKKDIFLQLTSLSELPAYDIDILVIAVFSEMDIKIKDFVNKYMKSDYKYKITADDEGFYYLFDRLYYQVCPVKSKVTASIDTINSSQFFILLQYRDTFGNNYTQEYWFTQAFSRSNKEKYFKLSSLRPIPIVKTSRIDFDYETKDIRSLSKNIVAKNKLITEDGSKLPGFLKDFSMMLEHSFPSGMMQKASFKQNEDRGFWQPI